MAGVEKGGSFADNPQLHCHPNNFPITSYHIIISYSNPIHPARCAFSTHRYSAPFRDEVQGWIVKLSTVSEIVEQWLMVQSMWMYMEAVFSGGDIVKQLPQEAKRFQNIDKNYMKIVTSALETLNVVTTCCGNELMKSMLPHLLEQLELCQKSLSAYLETKRAEFPRFYFVSDPTLLEILSLGSDPPSVVPHFQSGLFDSLTNVTFDRVDKTKMTEMFSQQQEKVEFEKAIEAKGNIEVWLQRLVDGMQDTIKQVIRRAVRNVAEMTLDEFIFSHPAQVALLGIQFQWTADTQAALSNAKTDKTIMSKNMKKVGACSLARALCTIGTCFADLQVCIQHKQHFSGLLLLLLLSYSPTILELPAQVCDMHTLSSCPTWELGY